MAKKVILMKLLQEVRGHAQITNRRPAPRPPALFLMQLRERFARNQTPKPQQRRAILTDWQNTSEVPLPVRINHLQAGQSEIPIVIG